MNTLGARLSRAGSVISFVCAVHCALTPAAVLALPLLAAQYAWAQTGTVGALFSPAAEWALLGSIVVIAGFGVLVTYPVHGDRRPAVMTVAGFAVLLSVRLFAEQGTAVEIAGDLLGASSIAWGGWVNRALCRCYDCRERDGAPKPGPAAASEF